MTWFEKILSSPKGSSHIGVVLGRLGFHKSSNYSSGITSYNLRDFSVTIVITNSNYRIIDDNEGELVNISKDSPSAMSDFIDNLNWIVKKYKLRKYPYSVNSTNWHCVRSFAKKCSLNNLNPRDPEFLHKYLEIYGKKESKYVKLIYSLIDADKINTIEATSIYFRFFMLSCQSKIYHCYGKKGKVSVDNKINLKSSWTHLNKVLDFLGYPKLKKSDFDYDSIGLTHVVDSTNTPYWFKHSVEYYKILLKNILMTNCYKYQGVRWHDIGLPGNFELSMSNFLSRFQYSKFATSRVNETSNGTPGNVSNSSITWSYVLEKRDKFIVFNGSWHQLGNAEVRIGCIPFLKATERYGNWDLIIYDEGFNELMEVLK